jgi:glycopeptide antibiotics resistance protein
VSAGAAVPWKRLWAAGRLLAALALVLLATTWPISDFQDHPHWFRVEWLPFSQYQRPFDVVANVLLFVPFGAAAAAGATEPRRARLAMYAGLAVALAVELSQVYTHNRIATTTDVITNTAGAWLGARWAVQRARARARGPHGAR